MKEEILKLFENKNYQSLTIDEIFHELHLNSASDFTMLSKTLVQLEDEYILYRSKKERYLLASDALLFQGVIKINNRGFGFVLQDEDDIFIAKDNLNGALNNDKVLVKVFDKSSGSSREGKVVKILVAANNVLIGTFYQKKGFGYVLLDDKKLNLRIDVRNNNRNGAVDGSKVKVKLGQKVDENSYYGIIELVIGHKNDPGIDILSTIMQYEIDIDFSEETMEYIKNIPSEVRLSDLEGRTDLRNEVIVTIDGEDAKDLDDAISIKKSENNYILGVHIADVSYYVEENSPLDIDAASRATSVYLVDRVVPMLPHYLSNNICSLNEGVDRLTISCEVELDENGKIISYNIYPSVINSNARMTYTDVNKILNGEVIEKYIDLSDKFILMHELSKILRKNRSNRGAIDFELAEGKVIVDENSAVIDIVARERFDAEKLIEDFMILANEVVASHFFYQELPFVYRIHGTPKEAKIQDFLRVSRFLGHKVKSNSNEISNFTIKSIIDNIGDDEGYVLRTLLLRSMQKAVYDVSNIGHFGLASKCYTHFTSPIRRYPDLMVHRLIRKYLINNDYQYNNKFIARLEANALHSSLKERNAMECEFAVLDMKKAEYMANFIGQKYQGIISSVTNFGLFVELPNTVEGLIRFADITTDHFQFDEKTLSARGLRTSKVFKLGDKLNIVVKKSVKETGEIDFILG